MRTAFLTVLLSIVLVAFLVPSLAFAAPAHIWRVGEPLVPCGTAIVNGIPSNPCGFNDLIQLIQNLITFMLWASVPVSTLLFAYAGFLYLTAGGKGEQVSKAHKIFLNIVIGVIIMLTAWTVVYLITNTLLSNEYKQGALLRNL